MKKVSFLVVAISLIVSATSCRSTCGNANLKTEIDSMSYAIGVSNGDMFSQSLKNIPGGELNIDALIAGFVEALKEKETKMTTEEAQEFLNTYFTNVTEREATKNKEEGEKFLAENKNRNGVITTASGLQYEIITEGTGKKPTANSKVKVDYHGTLLDGTVFDSSVDRGTPAEFGVGQVIPGWTEGLQLMSEGSKYLFWIPSDLAYGERGAGGQIKPNAALIFEVELFSVED